MTFLSKLFCPPKRTSAIDHARAMAAISADELRATRAHEDALTLARRRREDWALQCKLDDEITRIWESRDDPS